MAHPSLGKRAHYISSTALSGVSLLALGLMSGQANAQCMPISCTVSGSYTVTAGNNAGIPFEAIGGATLNIDAGTTVTQDVDPMAIVGSLVSAGGDAYAPGGTVNLNGTSGAHITLTTWNDFNSATGDGIPDGYNAGLNASGTWSGGAGPIGKVNGSYVDIVTHGVMANGAGAGNGGLVTLDHSTITVFNTGTVSQHGNGIEVTGSNEQSGADYVSSKFVGDHLTIVTHNGYSHGAFLTEGGQLVLTNSTIETGSLNANGHSQGILIGTSRNQLAGTPQDITSAELTNVQIHTHGQNGDGILVTSTGTQPAHVELTTVTIETDGAIAAGVLAQGNRTTVNGTDVKITINNGTNSLWFPTEAGHGVAAAGYDTGAFNLNGAHISLTNSTIDIGAGSTSAFGAYASGVHTDGVTHSTVTLDNVDITNAAVWGHGVAASNGGVLNISNSSIAVTGGNADGSFNRPDAGAGVALISWDKPIDDRSVDTTTTTTLNNVTVTSTQGAGVLAIGGVHDATATNSTITGVRAVSVNGWTLNMPGVTSDLTRPGVLNLTLDNTTLNGTAWVANTDGTTAAETGNVSASNLNLTNGSTWNMAGNSAVTNLRMNNATVNFAVPTAPAPTQADFNTLTVGVGGGTLNYTSGATPMSLVTGIPGLDGVGSSRFNMNTLMNAGGTLADQATDRLIVNGNVTGQHQVMVNALGSGAFTSTTGSNTNNEGISIIQVAGTSAADSFALANPGGYVAAGAYQYRMYAYGPGSSNGAADTSQNLTSNTSGSHWDYRLQTPVVVPPTPGCEATNSCPPPPPPPPCEDLGNCPQNPENPLDPREPQQPRAERGPLVPQAPTYINLPTAMLNAGFQDIDMLHRRLGELHDDNPNALNRAAGEKTDGEAFVRIYGGMFDYNSNRNYNNYGYDFDQNYVAVQMGANVYSHRNETAITRVGFALTLGDMSMETNSPNIFEGTSKAHVNTYSLQGYVTRQWDTGFYIDGVMSFGLFDGSVDSYARNGVGDVSGNSFAVGLEVGRPWHFAENWTLEPQAQLVYQRLSFDNQVDKDGIDVYMGSPQQVTGRIGARLTRAFRTDENQLITPYAKLNLIHGFMDDNRVVIGGSTFASGTQGTALQIGGGVTGTLNEHWSVYGDAAYQTSLSGNGFDGIVANAGVRYVW